MIYKIQSAQLVFIKKHKSMKEACVIPGDIPETGREQNVFRPLKLLQTQQITFFCLCEIHVDLVTITQKSSDPSDTGYTSASRHAFACSCF